LIRSDDAHGIGAVAAIDGVEQRVLVRPEGQIEDEPVIPVAAVDRVIAEAAIDEVVAAKAADRVVSGARVDAVILFGAVDDVVARGAVDIGHSMSPRAGQKTALTGIILLFQRESPIIRTP
jgi:hypothetical protein